MLRNLLKRGLGISEEPSVCDGFLAAAYSKHKEPGGSLAITRTQQKTADKIFTVSAIVSAGVRLECTATNNYKSALFELEDDRIRAEIFRVMQEMRDMGRVIRDKYEVGDLSRLKFIEEPRANRIKAVFEEDDGSAHQFRFHFPRGVFHSDFEYRVLANGVTYATGANAESHVSLDLLLRN